jgi:aspartyl-tRNA(Asn)/glutamyl-tRNA(Gln) amidotransferase subunit A
MLEQLPTTIYQASQALRDREYSAVELTGQFLTRIEEVEPRVHALLTITSEEALAQAQAADERLATGDTTSLLGVPIIYKDNFLTSGVKTTAGSHILEHYSAQYDADAVVQLKQAGAVMLGKANLDAFAHGSSTENSDFGPSFNPWNTDYVPGGSSGGSAAALAAQECLVSTGSDTGGSIRTPASFTGLVGIKPTYGRVSRYGVIAMGSSFDSIGCFTRDVSDCALVLEQIAGKSERDATTSPLPVPAYSKHLTEPIQGMKIGIAAEFFGEGLDPRVRQAVEEAQRQWQKLGIEFVPVALPHIGYSLAVYYILVPSELSSNLSRFDGIRFGLSAEASSLLEVYEASREQGFGLEAKRRIMLGTYALSSGYYDAYYKRAQKVRTLVKQDFDTVFSQVDALLAPVAPSLPFKIGERTNDPLAMYLTDTLTVPMNLAGVPSLSLPAGFADGLPIGMQLVGPQFSEQRLFQLGYAYQQQTDWHTRLAAVE